ncbi:RecQ family ATP-dependent DNA helicase [Ascidiimonas sp. W6]|uniref:RecQ family ATP-dependent DNA helicase n=1 Tax=Ascidiimonas meishanensis TaxID=3128903 RepID=UPI0030EEB7C9
MSNALDILQKYWGHKTFRYPQEEIINSVLQKKDTLALLPTGGGKSVCFQIPALLQPGICIVISPLVALIKDQATALSDKGIKTIALTGAINYSDLDAALDNAIYGNYKFLYLSPERLKQELVMDRIRQMPVNLIAVDEAHCISQWGNDFRPSYKEIALLRDPFPHVPIIALTATATTKVREDIIESLNFQNHHTFVNSFERANISYQVIRHENKLQTTIHLLGKHPGSAIIYVRNRKATLDISTYLKQHRITADFYHGGISSEDKQNKLRAWLKNEIRVIVATNAFGMGIDKPDVRSIFHLAMPENVENYYQEAGRAGRDEKPAFAYLIVSESDGILLKKQFLTHLPDVTFVKLVYRRLNNYLQIPYGEGSESTHQLKFAHFCSVYELPSKKTYNAMKLLDRHGVLRLSESFHRKTKVQFKVSTNQLFEYLNRNRNFEEITRAILRTYGGIFDLQTPINPTLIAKKTGNSEKKILDILNQLEKDNIIYYTANHTDAEITFLVPREDEQTIHLFANDIKTHLKLRHQQVEDMISYVNTNNVCRSIQLLRYFGETNASSCGICSVCISQPDKLTEEVAVLVGEAIIDLLKKKPETSENILKSLTFKEQTVLFILRSLLEKGKIKLNNINQYSLHK